MGYQPGDEKYVRKFEVKYPDLDPRVYYPWMGSFDGEMSRIMGEMLDEMMPMMMPNISDEDKARVKEQFKLKNMQAIQPGEKPGSLMDALKAVYPAMQMNPEYSKAGVEPTMMVNRMVEGWMDKYAQMPDVFRLRYERGADDNSRSAGRVSAFNGSVAQSRRESNTVCSRPRRCRRSSGRPKRASRRNWRWSTRAATASGGRGW